MSRQRHPHAALIVSLVLLTFASLTILKVPVLVPSSSEENGGQRNNSEPTDTSRPTEPDEATRARVDEAFGRLPLSFEINEGQFDQEVRYASRGRGYNLFLTPGEAVLVLSTQSRRQPVTERPAERKSAELNAESPAFDVLRMKLVGANDSPEIIGAHRQPGRSNYLVGSDSSRWHTDVAHYSSVEYKSVYSGIDLVYHGRQHQLEYDFVVAPQADPGPIRLAFTGADRMRIDERGDLLLEVAGGELRQHRPVVYQEIEGERKEVAGSYVIKGDEEIGFEIGEYDRTRPLVIDPVLSYSTLIDGCLPLAIAVDSDKNAYITGYAYSTDFPTLGAYQGSLAGSYDAFVTKFNAAGSALVFSTYLGGSSSDYGHAIAVDSDKNVYVAGETYSTNFPLQGAYQGSSGGSSDVFLTKLNAAGNALVYSTYLGGSSGDTCYSIAVDSDKNAYLTGHTGSTNFPLQSAYQGTKGGGSDAFVTKLNAAGNALVFSTYLGGSGSDGGYNLALDSGKNAYIAGNTYSTNFPLQGAFQGTYKGNSDAFVTKLNAAGSALVYSTYLGGSGEEEASGIAIDSAGNAHVAGSTYSTDFPLQSALQSSNGGNYDAFLTKLNVAGSALVFSTYLGGSGYDYGNGVALDTNNNVYIAGSTDSVNFRTVYPFQPFYGGEQDGFVAKINPIGTAFYYSTFLGGQNLDSVTAIAVDSSNNAYVTGGSSFFEDNLTKFPTTVGAYQETSALTYFGFVTKIDNSGQANSANFKYKYIKGRVKKADGTGLANVVVSLSGTRAASAVTDASGNYVFQYLATGGTFTVTPDGSFTPGSRTFEAISNNQINVDFTEPPPVTISGRIQNLSGGGIESIRVDVTKDFDVVATAFTGSDGSYSIDVLPGSAYTVVPSDSFGYQEGPKYNTGALTTSISNIDFTITSPTFTIAGVVKDGSGNPMPNITLMVTGPGDDQTETTDADGKFTFANCCVVFNSYGLAPTTPGYNYKPPFNSYSDDSLNVTITATRIGPSISGKVVNISGAGVGGVKLTLTGSVNGTMTTGPDGLYQFTDLISGGNYTVTATKIGTGFTPATRNFTGMTSNKTGAATQFTAVHSIQGRVRLGTGGLSGVTVKVTGSLTKQVSTNSNGDYLITNLTEGGNYTVTPSRLNYTIKNTSNTAVSYRTYPGLNTNRTGQDFAATLNKYTVSGKVVRAGTTTGVSGVVMSLKKGTTQIATATTDASGVYKFPNTPAAASYTVQLAPVAANSNFVLSPVSQSITNLSGNKVLSNFALTLKTYTITGKVTVGTASGAALNAVNLRLTASGFTAVNASTNSSGIYTINNVPTGRTYTLTPTKTGYTFNPSAASINNSTITPLTRNFIATGSAPLSHAPPVFSSAPEEGDNFALLLEMTGLGAGDEAYSKVFGALLSRSALSRERSCAQGALCWPFKLEFRDYAPRG